MLCQEAKEIFLSQGKVREDGSRKKVATLFKEQAENERRFVQKK